MNITDVRYGRCDSIDDVAIGSYRCPTGMQSVHHRHLEAAGGCSASFAMLIRRMRRDDVYDNTKISQHVNLHDFNDVEHGVIDCSNKFTVIHYSLTFLLTDYLRRTYATDSQLEITFKKWSIFARS